MNKLLMCLAVILAVASADNIPQPPIVIGGEVVDMDCPKVCPALHAPVCTTRTGKVYQMLNNRCEMRMLNCNRPRDMDSINDLIEVDPYWCTSEMVDNLIDKLEELKVDLNAPACLRPCPMIYRPVCVSNGEYTALLSNDCLLDGINCALEQQALSTSTTPNNFKVMRYDKC